MDDIPKDYFLNRKIIYGRVVRVIDGDTIRVRHCRSRWLGCPPDDPTVKRIYDTTLAIRIYGVDCPELQKRKDQPPSQPFAQEATDLTSHLVADQMVCIKLLRKDQYNRAVAVVLTPRRLVTIPPLSRKDLSMELLQHGYATLYVGGGAEYNNNREVLERKQDIAKKQRRGIWSLGDQMISPADYKRQQKQKQQLTIKNEL